MAYCMLLETEILPAMIYAPAILRHVRKYPILREKYIMFLDKI